MEAENEQPVETENEQTMGGGEQTGGDEQPVEAEQPQPTDGVVQMGGGGDVFDSSSKGNEDKKIFVGGISYDTAAEDLSTFFSQYGEVTNAQVKYDRVTGRSRGFAFVEFAESSACRAAMAARQQSIKGKDVEVKPAKSRENKKVFVGGLPSSFPEEELRAHFEEYGKVEDIEWPFDRTRNAKRNFAFIVFEEEEGADRASAHAKHVFGDRECDVKKAVPQGRRFPGQGAPFGGGGGVRGGFGGGGGRGRGGYGGGGGGGYWGGQGYGGAGGWGDWYNNAGNYYGNYYGAGGYGAGGAGAGGGYYDDYSSSNYNDYWANAWGQYGSSTAQQTPPNTAGYGNDYSQQQQSTGQRGSRY